MRVLIILTVTILSASLLMFLAAANNQKAAGMSGRMEHTSLYKPVPSDHFFSGAQADNLLSALEENKFNILTIRVDNSLEVLSTITKELSKES